MEKSSSKALIGVAVVAAMITTVLLMFHVVRTRRAACAGGARLAAATVRATPERWLGMTLQPVTATMRQTLALTGDGAIVSHVTTGGPAHTAGIQLGDLLQQLNGETVSKPDDVVAIVKDLDPSQVVKAVLSRQGRKLTLKLRVGNKPIDVAQEPPVLPEAEVEIEAAWLGLDIIPLTPAEAEDLGIDEAIRGMLVDGVAAGRGVDAGLAAGDVILAINGKPTRTIDEFTTATSGAHGALVDVLRGGRHVYVTVAPPGSSVLERKQMEQRLGLRTVNWDPWQQALDPAFAGWGALGALSVQQP